jgi:ABC-type branched-subunit amino acid transport system substrate-binding protein
MRLACGAAVLALFAAACGTSSGKATTTATSIKIGVVADVTGVYGQINGPTLEGVRAFFNNANEHGGIAGRKVSLVTFDTGSSPTQALAQAKKAVESKVFGLVMISQFAAVALPYLNQAGIPITGWAVSPGWNGPHMFSWIGPLGGQATSVPLDWFKQQGWTKIAIISDSSTGSAASGDQFLRGTQSRGLHVVYQNIGVPDFGANAASVAPVVQRIVSSGAQAVLSTMGVNGPLIQQLHQSGKNIHLFLLFGYNVGMEQQLGAAMNGVTVGLDTAPMSADNAGVKNFLQVMQNQGIKNPLWFDENGYISSQLFAKGLQLAGKNLTQDSFVNGLNSLKNYDMGGLVQPISFPEFHNKIGTCLALMQLQQGKWVQLPPEPFMCGSILY